MNDETREEDAQEAQRHLRHDQNGMLDPAEDPEEMQIESSVKKEQLRIDC